MMIMVVMMMINDDDDDDDDQIPGNYFRLPVRTRKDCNLCSKFTSLWQTRHGHYSILLFCTSAQNYSHYFSKQLIFCSIYRYGMETFSQLIVGGSLVNSTINIHDEPKYVHRGLMLDTG